MRPLAFIDVETTGLDPLYHEIIEIAIIQESVHGVSEWSTKIAPEFIDRATSQALSINGYDPDKWHGALPFGWWANSVMEKLSGHMIVGHNVAFDVAFVKHAMSRAGADDFHVHYHSLDTVTLVYEHLTPCGLRSLSLAPVCDVLGVSNEGAHSALVDSRRCREVFHKLVRATDEDRARWTEIVKDTVGVSRSF